jgi:hypothetical protein
VVHSSQDIVRLSREGGSINNPVELSCSFLINSRLLTQNEDPALTEKEYRVFTLDRYPGFGYSAQAVTDWGIVQW